VLTAEGNGVQLSCDEPGCTAVLDGADVVSLFARARAANWHLFDGHSITGKPLTVHLCAISVGKTSTPGRKSGPLPDDQVLF
jgi:hypothetical protein